MDMPNQPNILFVMTDQQRFDTIAALGNSHIYTPNMDRLVQRGLSFTNAYSTCPVCVPARATVRTGCQPPTLRIFTNRCEKPVHGQADSIEERSGGPYLAKTLRGLGYRTFGIGKFHGTPWDADLGYDVYLQSMELYGSPERRQADAYASWLHREHPEYDHLEVLMGERSEMYYIPQCSAQPADCAVEGWAAARAIEQLAVSDDRPYFGFVSFVGPHPPFAPPIPFNRMYDPDRMPNPISGDIETDHMDQHLPRSRDTIWADFINDGLAHILKARYYGEISYIDDCLGKILDAVESRADADNTVICFFADHGDHLGDHHSWQKGSFFDASARIPFLVSWPDRLPRDERRSELVSLEDLFAVATGAAGKTETREGIDLLNVVAGKSDPRDHVIGYHERPGTHAFKIMVRGVRWKYIFFANGGLEQLFDMQNDPHELCNTADSQPEISADLRQTAIAACRQPGARDALDGDDLMILPFKKWEWKGERTYQFAGSLGITGFPEKPEDVLKARNQSAG